MERLEQYRDIVRRVIEDYASVKSSHGKIVKEAIVDPTKDHYEVIHVGWDGPRRIHGTVIHIDIIDGKIWVQCDNTNRPVVDELEAAGIPRSDIVLAFHPEHLRQFTGYATGG